MIQVARIALAAREWTGIGDAHFRRQRMEIGDQLLGQGNPYLRVHFLLRLFPPLVEIRIVEFGGIHPHVFISFLQGPGNSQAAIMVPHGDIIVAFAQLAKTRCDEGESFQRSCVKFGNTTY